MKTRKEKLEDLKKSYKSDAERYYSYIYNLKNVFFEHEMWNDKKSPLVISSEQKRMTLAYVYARNFSVQYYYEYNVSQFKQWKSEETLDYYIINDRIDERWGTIPASVIVRLENLKELSPSNFKKYWKKLVAERNLLTGFKDWFDETSVEGLLDIMKDDENVFVVNEPFLDLKDIIVIIPD